MGLGVKRLKNVVSDLETKCEGLSFEGHELNESQLQNESNGGRRRKGWDCCLIWGGFRGCQRIMEVTSRSGWKERREEIVCLGR